MQILRVIYEVYLRELSVGALIKAVLQFRGIGSVSSVYIVTLQ